MELRIDRLLGELRERSAEVLAAIDADPLLLKRESGGLVLANAGQELFTPQAPHHLFAKGVVYRRDPYELVSLPLVKMYNLGERGVTAADLAELGVARLHFLRKLDGTMVQRFQHDGRAWLTTRGMIEGAALPRGAIEAGLRSGFDYLGAVRRIAAGRYPRLLEERPELDGLTLVFELIHPEARIITDYGDREDLVLLTVFDRRAWRYWAHAEVAALGAEHGLTTVDALSPSGESLAEQIEAMLASLAGTDQEGSVLTFEEAGRVVYRVKVKSPDYLRLMKLAAECTYDAAVKMLDANSEIREWPDFEAHLKGLGREQVPEELLPFYREHFEKFAAYRAGCERLLDWARNRFEEVRRELSGVASGDAKAYRKAFAERVRTEPHAGLLFAALDGRLDLGRVRQYAGDSAEAAEALRKAKNLTPPSPLP